MFSTMEPLNLNPVIEEPTKNFINLNFFDPSKNRQRTFQKLNTSLYKFTIFKIIAKDIFLQKPVFSGIKLVFDNKTNAKEFRDKLLNFLVEQKIHSFTMHFDTPNENILQMVMCMNSSVNRKIYDNPEKAGELMLAELEQYVEISGIPQEFRSGWQNRILDADDIPSEYQSFKAY